MSTATSLGSMRTLVDEFDWSASPLGARDRWPQSLRAAVQIVLTSRFAMWMSWGPDLTFLYNDAYGAMTLGEKHPWALGKPSREVWAEIWPDIGPRIQHVLDTGEATWDERLLLFLERSGYPEETYHTFSYSPLSDDDSTIAGHLCVVTEETERVIGERRLGTLRQLASELATSTTEEGVVDAIEQVLRENARDLPFVMLYLYDDESQVARLAACIGIDAEHPAAPREIDLQLNDSPWPARAVLNTHAPQLVPAIDARFHELPTGEWTAGPRDAIVMPIAHPGQDQQAGFLVAGLNPYRQFDDAYAGFVSLIAGQVASSLGNARAYEAERRRAEALAELDRAKTQFFSNVSHEFRTPLTLILGPLEDVLRKQDVSALKREEIEVVHRNALRLLKLVNTLLDFSRIEAGRVQAMFVPTDVSRLTLDIASSFRSAIERSGLELVLDAPPVGVPAYLDQDMWEKVVLNLLSNAFKHTFDGRIRVSVRRAEDGEHIELSVSDTGVGIAADQLPHLFERFHRVPNARSRTFEGTGIGLALVQELVRLHGGEIRVESHEGTGSTFVVCIPLGKEHLPADQVGKESADSRRRTDALDAHHNEAMRWTSDAGDDRISASAPEATSTAQNEETAGAHVLLADDNADMREYVQRLLTNAGWRVTAVGDGNAALRAALIEPPDLVLSDVMMPGLDGFELLRAMRAEPQTSEVPVILLSARAGEEARVGGMSAGAEDYLVKPFSAQELVARVGAHLRLARMRRQASDAIRVARDVSVAAERRLRSLVAQAPVAVAVFRGRPPRYEIVNEYYAGMVGRDADELLGKRLPESFPEFDLSPREKIMEEVLETGVAYREDEHYSPVLRPGGRKDLGYFNYVYQPLRNENDVLDGVAVVATEVTPLVLAREAAQAHLVAAEQSRAAAEAANTAKTGFLAAMSHELRTPLNAIQGHVQLIEMGLHGEVTYAQREALARVQRSQQHLLGLINDVLNYAKIEAGRVDYRCDPVNIRSAIDDVCVMIEPQMLSNELTFVHDTPADLAAFADREKMQQIVLNLLANSIKFTERRGRITVSTRACGNLVEICVTDTGIGIAPEKCESIFEPFVQLERNLTRHNPGTGLGLAISRDLARGMHGDLWVTSSEGSGSTFTLSLPATP